MKTYLILTAITVGFLVPTHAAHTQTTFAWPEAKVNLTGYRYLENCVVVGGRVWDSVRSVQGVLSDTVFYPRGRIGAPTPDKVQASLRECLSHYIPTQVPRDYTLMAQGAYLQAGQVAEAEATVRHGLSQIATTDTASRAALIDSAIEKYAKTPPYQLELVKMYIDTLEHYGTAYRSWNLLRDYFWLMHAAYVTGDDSLAFRVGQRVFALAPEAIKGASPPEIAAVGISVAYALRIARGQEILDSLRKGTAAYAALYTTQFRQTMGFVPPEQPRDLEAPVLQGDYWFPTTAATQEYPRKGRASMVVFVPDRMSTGDTPVQLLSTLRRLSHKYPMVDLVLVTCTMGNFGPLEPPPPEREAFLADSVFRHFHRLNPVLSVTKGSYVQFDAPDNRRFYQPYPNLEAYPPHGSDIYRDPKYMKIILVDDHQRIVDQLLASDEGWMIQLIDTLLARMAGAPR